jgi:hypothetical protein
MLKKIKKEIRKFIIILKARLKSKLKKQRIMVITYTDSDEIDILENWQIKKMHNGKEINGATIMEIKFNP